MADLQPINLLVVGECGDGKSSLIVNLLDKSKSEPPVCGTNPRGVTKDPKVYQCHHLDGQCLNLIDMPGFGNHDVNVIALVSMIEAILMDDMVPGGIRGVILTVPIPDPRIRLSAQILQALVDKSFAPGDKYANIILCGTKADKADDDEKRLFMDKVKSILFNQSPKTTGQCTMVGKDDCFSLLEAIRGLPASSIVFEKAEPKVMAEALAEKLGMRPEDMAKQLNSKRQEKSWQRKAKTIRQHIDENWQRHQEEAKRKEKLHELFAKMKQCAQKSEERADAQSSRISEGEAGEAAELWYNTAYLQRKGKEALSILKKSGLGKPEGETKLKTETIVECFRTIHEIAEQTLTESEDSMNAATACHNIISTTRELEELLRPLLPLNVVSGADPNLTILDPEMRLEESETFTQHTVAEDESSQIPEGPFFGGGSEVKVHELEHRLLELKNEHHNNDHPEIARTLYELGQVYLEAGDPRQARAYLLESVQMYKSLLGDKDDASVANALHSLGAANQEAADLNKARDFFQESLHMKRSLFGKDHPSVAVTLHSLGRCSQQSGHLKQAEMYFNESLRVNRSKLTDQDDHRVAETLHALGELSQQTGDPRQGVKYLQESLQLQRSLHGDRDHAAAATTLHKLGDLTAQGGDVKQGIQYLQESLQMQQSLHGDRDHPGIAATLHKLGDLMAQNKDLKQGLYHLRESLRMQRSLHPDCNHPGIAASLHKLGDVTLQTGDVKQGMQYLQESLQMQQSLHGDRNHPGIATTLQKLGDGAIRTGDVEKGMQYLLKSLVMQRSLHGDRDHLGIAATLHKLGDQTAQKGDLKQGAEYLQESLRMQRSLLGGRDSAAIATTLHKLGDVTARTGDVKNGMEYLQECLRMQRSLHGDGDHAAIATTLHKLGNLSAQIGDLMEGIQYLQESLQMKRSLHGDSDHPGIAATLHKLGDLTAQTGDLGNGTQYLQESLRMQRSLHVGDKDKAGIALTLHKLGVANAQMGDVQQGLQCLQESLQMNQAMHGGKDHVTTADTLHSLGMVFQQAGNVQQASHSFEESLRMKRSLFGHEQHLSVAATQRALIVEKFKSIRHLALHHRHLADSDTDAFGDASQIRKQATEILTLLQAETEGPDLEDLSFDSTYDLFAKIFADARDMSKLGAHFNSDIEATWIVACHRIILASRKAEEILKPEAAEAVRRNVGIPVITEANELNIMDHFGLIREAALTLWFETPGDDLEHRFLVWEKVGLIRQLTKVILKMFGGHAAPDFGLQDETDVSVLGKAIWDSATEMLMNDEGDCVKNCSTIVAATWRIEELLLVETWRAGVSPQKAWINGFREIRELALHCEFQIQLVGQNAVEKVQREIAEIQQLAKRILQDCGASLREQVDEEEDRDVSDIFGAILDVAADILVGAGSDCVSASSQIIHATRRIKELLNSLLPIVPKNAIVSENAVMSENVVVNEHAVISENVVVNENAVLSENVVVNQNVVVSENVIVNENPSPKSAIIDQPEKWQVPSATSVSIYPESVPSAEESIAEAAGQLSLAADSAAMSSEGFSTNIKIGVTDGQVTAEFVPDRPQDCMPKSLPWSPAGHAEWYYRLWIQKRICLHYVTGTCVKNNGCKWLHPNYDEILDALMRLIESSSAEASYGKGSWQGYYEGQ